MIYLFFLIFILAFYFMLSSFVSKKINLIICSIIFLFCVSFILINENSNNELIKEGNALGYYNSKSEAVNSSFVTDYKNDDLIDFLDKVNDEIEVSVVGVNSKGEYNIGLLNNEGNLVWISAKNSNLKVELSKDKNYLKRVKNSVLQKEINDEIYYYSNKANYILYIKKEDIKGETHTESCGKKCTKEIENYILN